MRNATKALRHQDPQRMKLQCFTLYDALILRVLVAS